MPQLQVGLKHEASLSVTPELTVPSLAWAFPGFVEIPPVFATALMVGFIEATCVAAIKGFLDPGQGTVGTHIDVSHTAATPAGGTVTVAVELAEIDGRRLVFHVKCRDGYEPNGEGRHERFIIDVARFNARVARKSG